MLLVLLSIVLVPLLFVAASALVLVGTIWIQGYIYTEPAQGMLWRAPAAVFAVGLYLTVWVYFVSGSHGNLGTLTDFNASNTEEFTELWVTDRDGKEKDTEGRYHGHFKRAPGGKYRDVEGTKKELPSRPDGVKVKDKDQVVLFKPDRDDKGNFRVDEVTGWGVPRWLVAFLGALVGGFVVGLATQAVVEGVADRKVSQPVLWTVGVLGGIVCGCVLYFVLVYFDIAGGGGVTAAMPLKYRDDKGRIMEEGQFGTLTSFRSSWLFANLLLNGLHLIVWWLALWLLLRFQGWHAFGIAVIVWLVTMFLLLPPLFARVGG
jgi:hypothetical protein